MDMVCPLCNGIKEEIEECSYCGGKMVDEGAIVNYLDDYSPYLSNDITQKVDGAPYDKCVHLFKCEKCGKDRRVEVQRVNI
ncbi:hypothetical protein GOQ29_06200 [Clostridium sp. D2Q-14]|uniref:hypothetical protein n=1 Tax=Anaeromonas gelatinilytica TaxID=2683194 RepID=UPI00193B0E96|nr:hypothetical protein [Anaeromonas gelatinilytica]MBS4535211.1 hypothetical protein [Anaeromonas gelatinilytica]